MRQWQLVKDCVPDHSRPVWVTDGVKVGKAVFAGWVNAWSPWNQVTVVSDSITHWMDTEPVPEPPCQESQTCFSFERDARGSAEYRPAGRNASGSLGVF